jgi:hypothetical protein
MALSQLYDDAMMYLYIIAPHAKNSRTGAFAPLREGKTKKQQDILQFVGDGRR